MIVAILVIGLLFALANPTFGSVTNLSNVASQVSLVGVIAVSSIFVLITGEIDLCVGRLSWYVPCSWASFSRLTWRYGWRS